MNTKERHFHYKVLDILNLQFEDNVKLEVEWSGLKKVKEQWDKKGFEW